MNGLESVMVDRPQNTVLLDAVQVPLMIINRSGVIIGFNRVAKRETGIHPSELVGKQIWDTDLQSDDDLRSAFPLDSVASTLTRFQTSVHDNHYIQWSIRSVITDIGVPQWVCTGSVISHHEPPYRQMFEYNPAMMLLISPDDGRIINANRAATQFYGYSAADLSEMTLQELTQQPHSSMVEELRRGIANGQDFLVFQHHTSDNNILDVEIFPSYVELGDTQLMYCVVVDVTDRNMIEDALRSSELQYRQLVELMQEGLAVHNENNINTYVNDKLTEMLGYSRDEILDRPITDFMDDDNTHIVQEYTEVRQTGRSTKYELVFIHRNGQAVYTLVASTPIIDDDGHVTGSFSVITDITEQKLAEESLRQSNAELDAFAHTVAHDLKSPISVMMGFANILESDFGRMSDHELKDYLHTMARTSDKMITIIDELLLLSEMRNIDEVDVHDVDMNEVIVGALERVEYMREQYGATIDIPDADSWVTVPSHAQWIEEVWVNYLTNGIKYGGQPPQIEIGCTDRGDSVQFWVKDNGRGIPPESLDEVFMPFTRLEQVRIKGHGLGLSIVQRIITKLGGVVQVESEVGQGSLFSFYLPKEFIIGQSSEE